MEKQSRRHARSTRSQSGAVVVEAAIVSLLLLVISFGIVEFGLLFGKADDVADLVRSGARTGTATNGTPADDAQILRSIKTYNGKLGEEVQQVVIYKANGINGRPPEACMNGATVAGVCNVYGPSDFGLSASALAAKPNANGWPWATRVPAVDYLGVYVKADHSFITKFFQKNQNYNDFSIMRLDAIGPSNPSNPIVNGGWTSGASVPFVPPSGQYTVPYQMPCDQDCGGDGDGGSVPQGNTF